MGKAVAGLFMSLDGVVEADDDWQFDYFDEEVLEATAAGGASAGATLMGRRSFEGYDRLRAEHPDSPMVAFLDKTAKYVVSTTLQEPGWPDTTVVDGDLYGQLTRLKQQVDGDLLVLGSPTLVRWLLAHDLLDELNLLVLPIVVGSGLRLFDDKAARHYPLSLVRSRAMGNGVLDLLYAPVGS